MLERWDVEEPLSLAGLYHSIYGTEGFQVSFREVVPVRDDVGAATPWPYVNDAPLYVAYSSIGIPRRTSHSA